MITYGITNLVHISHRMLLKILLFYIKHILYLSFKFKTHTNYDYIKLLI